MNALRKTVVAGVFVAGAVLAGCEDDRAPLASDGASDGGRQGDAAYVDGPVVAQPKGNGEGLDGGVSGSVTMRDGCLLVDQHPVVWPHATTWEPELEAVRLPDGALARSGDAVRGGGGYLPIDGLPEPFSSALSRCPSEQGEAAVFNSQGEVLVLLEGRLDVHPATGPDPSTFPPPEVHPLASMLAELVDFHELDFSGSWFDRPSGQMVIGVATDAGKALLAEQGLADDKRVRPVPARWSLREAQEILNTYLARSMIKDRFVKMGVAPAGDGFQLSITGDDLSDSEVQDLLKLPGTIEVSTGFAGDGGS